MQNIILSRLTDDKSATNFYPEYWAKSKVRTIYIVEDFNTGKKAFVCKSKDNKYSIVLDEQELTIKTLKDALLKYMSWENYETDNASILQCWNSNAFKNDPGTYIDAQNNIWPLKPTYCSYKPEKKEPLANEVAEKVEKPQPKAQSKLSYRQFMEVPQVSQPIAKTWATCIVNRTIERLVSLTISEPKKEAARQSFKSVMAEVRFLYCEVYKKQWAAFWTKWNTSLTCSFT